MSEQDKLLLTEGELRNAISDYYIYDEDGWFLIEDSHWDAIEAQLAKVKQHYEQKLQQMALNYDIIIKETKQHYEQDILDRPELCDSCDTPLLREGELYLKIKEAKREEREIIFEEIKKHPLGMGGSHFYLIDMELLRQALKGEK